MGNFIIYNIKTKAGWNLDKNCVKIILITQRNLNLQNSHKWVNYEGKVKSKKKWKNKTSHGKGKMYFSVQRGSKWWLATKKVKKYEIPCRGSKVETLHLHWLWSQFQNFTTLKYLHGFLKNFLFRPYEKIILRLFSKLSYSP